MPTFQLYLNTWPASPSPFISPIHGSFATHSPGKALPGSLDIWLHSAPEMRQIAAALLALADSLDSTTGPRASATAPAKELP